MRLANGFKAKKDKTLLNGGPKKKTIGYVTENEGQK